jgi:hypothetical protein
MPKTIPDAALDAMLQYEDDADVLRVCSTLDATPTHAEIVTATLASIAMTPGDGNGDYVIADGDTSGRKLRVLAQTAIPVTASGDANHIALTKTSDTTVRAVTTCTTQTLTSGNTVNTPEFKHEVADVT